MIKVNNNQLDIFIKKYKIIKEIFFGSLPIISSINDMNE